MSDGLLAAVEKRSIKAIEAALAAGADLEARDEDGMTGLLLLCKSKSGAMSATEIAAALLLIDKGADVNAKGDYGQRPLHFVVQSDGKHAVIDALIAKGAEWNVVDDGGNTLLHTAVDSTHAKDTWVFDRLIGLGCDVNARNESKETPLHRAAICWNEKGVKYLLEHGADPSLEDADGLSVVGVAKKYNQEKILKLLEAKPKSAKPKAAKK